jgi:transcriptional regulator with XRE-family HTH domain
MKMSKSELSKRVKELRSRKGLSQEQLAENSGLSLRTIQRIENGETEPRGDTLKRLMNALDAAPDDLMDWSIAEDKGFLTAVNLSALGFFVFPLLGILIPLIMWI